MPGCEKPLAKDKERRSLKQAADPLGCGAWCVVGWGHGRCFGPLWAWVAGCRGPPIHPLHQRFHRQAEGKNIQTHACTHTRSNQPIWEWRLVNVDWGSSVPRTMFLCVYLTGCSPHSGRVHALHLTDLQVRFRSSPWRRVLVYGRYWLDHRTLLHHLRPSRQRGDWCSRE